MPRDGRVPFDLDSATRRELGHDLIDRIDAYFASLPTRPVQPPLEDRTTDGLSGDLPEFGEAPAAVLDELWRGLVHRGFHTPSAGYCGLQNPTPAYVAILAEALVAALNPQLASMVHSPLASRIEQDTVGWIGQRVGWGRPFAGTFTSGGSEANFTALALALAAHFPGSVADGIASIGARPVFYATAEAHQSVDKAASLLGLGRTALRRIPVTPAIQLDVDQLESRIRRDRADGCLPFCVVATAGTTASGAIDDISAIGEVCARHRLWLHVDGAYGAAVILSDRHRRLVRGIERADSVTIDPHKWLAMPMSAGMILTCHPETLREVFMVANPFMPKADGAAAIDHCNLGLQWSRRMNSLKLWLTLRVHGRRAYEDLIDRQLELARDFAEWVQGSEDFELVAPQVLPSVIFRVRRPSASKDEIRAANEALVEDVTRDGRRWISSAIVNGDSVVRMLVISYLTERSHLDELKAALVSGLDQPARRRERLLW
jgi:aromatic-L-amino-acid decarboxylase